VVDSEQQFVDESVEYVIEWLHDQEVIDGEPSGDYDFDITREKEADIKSNLQEKGYIDEE
jgi:hypothetical protein